jgi:hypothetical protein
MQHSAVFLGGALLGGVLAAACGFDLYPIEETAHATLVAARARSADLDKELEVVHDDQRRLLESEAEARVGAGRMAQDLELVRQELDTARADKETIVNRLDDRDHQLDRLSEELVLTRADLTRFRGELAAARDAADDARSDLFALALRFFSVPRPESDRGLAAAFLSSDRTPGELVEFVLNLRYNSPDLLLSLGLAQSGSCPFESLSSVSDLERARIVPANADLEEVAN